MSAKKEVRQRADVKGCKVPKSVENPDSYLNKNPKWAFQRCDIQHDKWSIKNFDFYEEIFDKLVSYEGMTWSEIQASSGGKRNGTNSHFESVSDLTKDAQKRIRDLHMYDVDQLFSLRLGGQERLYGILENGVFYVLWYDKYHEVYKSNLKHT